MTEYIASEHGEIHERLSNWGRWARSHQHYGHCMSIEHQYRAPRGAEVEWETASPPPPPLPSQDLQDALAVERVMRHLPRKNRDALRLRYVSGIRDERVLGRRLRVRFHLVAECLYRSRQMVVNLTRSISAYNLPFHNSGKPLTSDIESPARTRFRFIF